VHLYLRRLLNALNFWKVSIPTLFSGTLFSTAATRPTDVHSISHRSSWVMWIVVSSRSRLHDNEKNTTKNIHIFIYLGGVSFVCPWKALETTDSYIEFQESGAARKTPALLPHIE
jgi:hypothetical protein